MIPWVRPDLCARRVLVMQWVDGMRCTDPAAILASGIDVDAFIRGGVVSGLRQLLEFGLFHGDPHPGNIFCLPDGRIAYVDFGNVAELSARNKQTLVDAVVHAVNEDYAGMASDFIRLGFLAPGTDIAPIVPALESIWADSLGQSLADFNFRTVTTKFNALVYQHPIRIPERYALVIRSLLTQEGICLRLRPAFHFLEVAYPYIARRLLTDDAPARRARRRPRPHPPRASTCPTPSRPPPAWSPPTPPCGASCWTRSRKATRCMWGKRRASPLCSLPSSTARASRATRWARCRRWGASWRRRGPMAC